VLFNNRPIISRTILRRQLFLLNKYDDDADDDDNRLTIWRAAWTSLLNIVEQHSGIWRPWPPKTIHIRTSRSRLCYALSDLDSSYTNTTRLSITHLFTVSFFHRRVAHHSSFPTPNGMAIFRRGLP